VVLGSQVMYDDLPLWHVLELEQESPQHGLHCPHAHTVTATLCQFVYWRGNKTQVLTMRRSVRVELSTCHKVHLPPQISLTCSSIPRQLLGKCQHHTRFFSAGSLQELCTLDCPLPPYPKYCLHIYPHQITFDLFACTKLLLLPNIVTYYCFDEHHKYSTIIPHVLKYYYYHTKCSNTTIITQCAQTLLFSLHSATNPIRST